MKVRDTRSCLPTFLDDWRVPGIAIEMRCLYAYMRYRYAKEYLLSLTGIWSLAQHHTPHIRKRQLIRYYADKHELRTFVETGTYLGDMVSAVSRDFEEIHSIELSRPLYEKARSRFATLNNVHLYCGDSSTELVSVLDKMKHPALFWLDAHYSGEGTARGHIDSPVLSEINRIVEYGIMNDVILIDDAPLFNGTSGYPEIGVFRKYLLEKMQNYSFAVSDNVITLAPKEC